MEKFAQLFLGHIPIQVSGNKVRVEATEIHASQEFAEYSLLSFQGDHGKHSPQFFFKNMLEESNWWIHPTRQKAS